MDTCNHVRDDGPPAHPFGRVVCGRGRNLRLAARLRGATRGLALSPLACISARMLSVPAGFGPRPRESRGQTDYPITRFMGQPNRTNPDLFFERTFTNMSKDMWCRNRPNFNPDSGLTPNGRGPAGERPGSARERNAAGFRGHQGRRFGGSSPPGRPPRARRRRAGPEVRRPTSPSSPRPSGASAAPPASWPPSSPRPGPPPASRRRPPAGPEPARPSPAPTSNRTSSRPPGPACKVLAAAARSRAFTPSPAGLVAGA